MKLIYILFTLITFNISYSQISNVYLGTQQDPPEPIWKKIDSKHFEVIFPENIGDYAQRIVNTLEYSYKPVSKSLEIEPKKLSLVLHNQNTISNGFFTLAPRRSEWYNTPPQFGLVGSNDWFTLLSVHEFRHVVQFDKVNSGFTRFLYYLFGENGLMAGSGLTIPMWYWEGDAVGIETALTKSGRGRMPEFDMPIRAMLLSGMRHSYYKHIFGSYVDWIADPYSSGYLMTTHVKRKYGNEIWQKILSKAMWFSFLPYSFSLSLNSVTGNGVENTYEETMDEMDSLTLKQISTLNITTAKRISNINEDGFFTNYLFPQYLSDSSIIAFKYGLGDRYQFVRIYQNKDEEFLFYPGNIYGNPYSISNDLLVWNEFEYDPRWSLRDYSVIKTYDLQTKKIKQITSGTRYFSPAISPDSKKIAVVEYTEKNECTIVILDSESGKIIRRLPNPSNMFLMNPHWSSDGKKLVMNRLYKNKKAISTADLDKERFSNILSFNFENSEYPIFYDEYILFNAAYSGINNIYAIDTITREIYQVTSRGFGAFNPSIFHDGSLMAFNDYTSEGYTIAQMKLDPKTWVKFDKVEHKNISYYEPLIKQENPLIIDSIPKNEYPIEDYDKQKNLINIHSWSIVPGNSPNNISLSAVSQNILGTLQSRLGFEHDLNEKTNSISLSASYAALYPIIDAGIRIGSRSSSYKDYQDKTVYYSWREQSLNLGVRVPLNLTNDVNETRLLYGANISLINISGQTYTDNFKNGNGLFLPVNYFISYFKGYQWISDINPVWGHSFTLSYSHTPFSGDYNGRLFSMDINLYVPGIFKHHSFRTEIAYEGQNPDNYHFESRILFPRGYAHEFNEQLLKIGFNYAFPFWYPDANILGALYFKRFKTNLFYDYAEARNESVNSFYKSFGCEFNFRFTFSFLSNSPSDWCEIFISYNYKRKKIGGYFWN